MGKRAQSAVGIDLGTTYTVVASLDASGRPATVVNAEGDLTTPSVVFFDNADIIVGREAAKAALTQPENVAQGVKREMGKPIYSRAICGEFFPPEVIQSLVLEKVKRDAEGKVGPIADVVITVPAYFDEPRRKATQDAGRLAGLNVVDIINEPTAAAIAYGVRLGFLDEHGESKRLERVVVYDLGGGTFDATLMEIDGKNYRVLATDGDVQLGGLDWDQRIVDHCAQQFLAEFRVDPRSEPQSLQRLHRDVEDAKRSLSARKSVTIPVSAGGHASSVTLTRDEFENLTADLLDRTRFTVAELVRLSGVKWDDVTRILLVGGSTRMPMVTAMLTREFGRPIDASLAVDEAVAHGAALYAGLLQSAPEPMFEPWTVTNVNSHPLGVLGVEPQTRRRRTKVIIPKNTPLPTAKTKRFRTYQADQRTVDVRIVEGGDASGNHATHIGRCVIRDLPRGLPEATQIDVTFSYAANGRLSVHARVPSVGREARLDIERTTGLTSEQLDEWGERIEERFRPLNMD